MTAPARASWTRSRSTPRPRSSPRSRSTQLAARLLSAFIDKEVRPGHLLLLAVDPPPASMSGLVNDASAVRRSQCAQAERRHRADRTQRFEYFGLRTVYDRYLLASDLAQRLETPQYFFLRIALRSAPTRARSHRALRAVLALATTCRAHRRCSMPARGTSSSRAASCSTRRTIRWSPSTTATRTLPCSRSSPAVSASPSTASAAKAR